jgi:hypothetical protein
MIGFILFLIVSSFHYIALTQLHRRLTGAALPGYFHVVGGITGAGFAHIFEALIYSFGFRVAAVLNLGGFQGQTRPFDFMDIFYFSLVNFTSLGLGDIYPTGHLRFLAGLESLNGFLLISCSASLIFLLMRDAVQSP